jgi:peptidoglycan-N-acetylglucosamine deacetylase
MATAPGGHRDGQTGGSEAVSMTNRESGWRRRGLPLMGACIAVAVAALGTACARGAGRSPTGRPATGAPKAAPGAQVQRALFSAPTSEKIVALTYDDGPGVGDTGTPAILALLEEHHARATFFVLGEEVHDRPEVLKAAAKAGMEIENHGERHVHMASLAESALTAVIAQGAQTIQKETGRRPHFLRPPFGAQNARVRAAAHALGERVVIWSVDTRDWTNPGSDVVVQRVLDQLKPGAIVLMHDGGSDRTQTVDATRDLLPALAARGYRMVTLDELLKVAAAHPAPPPKAARPRPRPPKRAD